MKKLVSITEVSGEGFESLMGEYITVSCLNYIYSGKLIGVNTDDILLTEAVIVYETGELCGPFKDAQALPNDLYIRTSTVESYYKRA